MGGDGGGGDAVLACARFRDDARLFSFVRLEGPGDGVVDFVRAGVEKVFAFEVDARREVLVRRLAN